ncbi:unnamed protein product [Thelazia callipaeda]|uniref:Major sperm protein n=1 Tax=Thelazia callipaeda TaxID=103827 RepID=A0A0N5DBS5_THECL|nr:unnamed protein product [Thelazia callipaeda]
MIHFMLAKVEIVMVTFSTPLTERQTVDLDIKNDWNKAIIFKMKTTRPDAFKMKPVYGHIDCGSTKKIVLTLKKWDPTKKPKKNDHFTVVMAPAPDKCSNPMKTWKSWKESKKSESSIGACRRVIKITYKGMSFSDEKKKAKGELPKAQALKVEEEEAKKVKKEEKATAGEDAKEEEKLEDEGEKKAKRKTKKKKEEEEEEEEEKPKKKGKKGKKVEEEEEEDDEEEAEKPKKKCKSPEKEDEDEEEEKAKNKGKKEDEDDEGEGEE